MDPRERLKALIAEKCVLRGEFVLASGQRSKVFFDCKRVTLDPEGLHLIAEKTFPSREQTSLERPL